MDLAKAAGLKKPRNVREFIIPSLIKDGIITEDSSSARSAGATNVGLYRTKEVITGRGNRGGKQTITEYWLNKAAAIHVVMAMRTPKANDLQKKVVTMALKFEEMATGNIFNDSDVAGAAGDINVGLYLLDFEDALVLHEEVTAGLGIG